MYLLFYQNKREKGKVAKCVYFYEKYVSTVLEKIDVLCAGFVNGLGVFFCRMKDLAYSMSGTFIAQPTINIYNQQNRSVIFIL